MRGMFRIAALMAMATSGFQSSMSGMDRTPIGPGKGKFWDKPNRKTKMNLSEDDLDKLAAMGGRTKKEFVKTLKEKYL